MEITEVSLPKYIQNLLSSDPPLDCYVMVGDPLTGTPERIGVLKRVLIAHSSVLRRMLLESDLRETGEINITDLDPQTFKNFVMFLYGYDNTSTLSFEDAIKLLNAAEKYDVQDLKEKTGKLIESQLTVKNIFVVLREAYVCEQVVSLWETATDLIKTYTEEIFDDTQFLDVSTESVVYIIQQEDLSVPEIEVWRAVLKWAKHKVKSEEGVVDQELLQKTVRRLLKHIRLCTLTPKMLCKEVAPTRILTDNEVVDMCVSVGEQKISDGLQDVCNDIKKRGLVSKFACFKAEAVCSSSTTSRIDLDTKQNYIELCSVVCQADKGNWGVSPQQPTIESTIKITVSNCNENVEPARLVVYSQHLAHNQEVLLTLKCNHKNILLKPYTKYNLHFESSHLLLKFKNYVGDESLTTLYSYRESHLKFLHYKVIAK